MRNRLTQLGHSRNVIQLEDTRREGMRRYSGGCEMALR